MILLRNVPNSCGFGHWASAGTRQGSTCPNEQQECKIAMLGSVFCPLFENVL